MSNEEPIFTARQVRELLGWYVVEMSKQKEWSDNEVRIAHQHEAATNTWVDVYLKIIAKKHPKTYQKLMEAKSAEYSNATSVRREFGLWVVHKIQA